MNLLDELDDLPVFVSKWPCATCGAHDAPSYNIDEEGQVTDCSLCADRLN